jgi:organic hydroperoxide reductase OsmC/OhrA
MHSYEGSTSWRTGKEGEIQAADRPAIRVGTPPEFGGPPDAWSPEQLFVSSVDSCLMSTFLFFAERAQITLRAYESSTSGRMEKTPNGLRFTALDVHIRVSVGSPAEVERAEQLRGKLEKYCPISNSLNCPVSLELVATAGGDQ